MTGKILIILILIFVGIFTLGKLADIPFIGIDSKDTEIWSIGTEKLYYENGFLKIDSTSRIKNPVLRAKNIKDRKTRFVADPFLVYEKGVYYMFFEALNIRSNGKEIGDIGLATSKDGINWKYDKIVLSETFHLSYPYVFKHGDTYYMIPESYKADEVRLYKATNFPYEWKFVKTLLSDKKLVDPTLIYYQDKWWLFAATTDNSDLYLYYADNLEGSWLEHASNPIVKEDKSKARCGGNIFYLKDKLIRIAQDDLDGYGSSINAYEIIKLNPEEYHEQKTSKISLMRETTEDWNEDGIHQFSIIELSDNEYLALFDGKHIKRTKFLYIELPSIVDSIFNKLVK